LENKSTENIPTEKEIENDPFFEDEFLKDLKKEALFYEINNDLIQAQLYWEMYFEKLSKLQKEPSENDLKKAFEIITKIW
jgi:hypothetical protein